MKLEDQVCNLELAKRLKELGVEQESCFSREINPTKKAKAKDKEPHLYRVGYGEGNWAEEHNYSAFTVSELGEMIGKDKKIQSKLCDDGLWEVRCYRMKPLYDESLVGKGDRLSIQLAKTEADARAKMLIYLLENKLINS